MSQSPIEEFLGALDRLDLDAIMALMAPDVREDDVWIAEVDASYELRDWLQLNALPRAFILRAGTDGVSELKAYGAHEHQLSNHPTGGMAMWIGGRWVPPL